MSAGVSELDRQAVEPLGEQLTRALRRQLENCEHGSRFHGDREVCKLFDVSLPVVRTAMANLVREGLIVRRPARGTFVCKPRRVQRAATGQIAVICPLELDAHAPALQGAQAALAAAGRDAVMVSLPPWPLDYAELAATIETQLERAAGAVVISAILEEHPEPVPELDRFARQVVLINANLPATRVSCLLADYEAAAFGLTTHLLETGRRRIAFAGGPLSRPVSRRRLAGYKAALRARGIPADPDLIEFDESDNMGGTEGADAIRRIAARTDDFDAVFAMTDYMAIGAMDALRDLGREVPGDVAVTGFDDRDVACHVRPTLTSARLPYRELGQAAAELLVQQLAGAMSPGTRRYVPCPLQIRQSSHPPTTEETAP